MRCWLVDSGLFRTCPGFRILRSEPCVTSVWPLVLCFTVLDDGRSGSTCKATFTSAGPSDMATPAAQASEESLLFLCRKRLPTHSCPFSTRICSCPTQCSSFLLPPCKTTSLLDPRYTSVFKTSQSRSQVHFHREGCDAPPRKWEVY